MCRVTQETSEQSRTFMVNCSSFKTASGYCCYSLILKVLQIVVWRTKRQDRTTVPQPLAPNLRIRSVREHTARRPLSGRTRRKLPNESPHGRRTPCLRPATPSRLRRGRLRSVSNVPDLISHPKGDPRRRGQEQQLHSTTQSQDQDQSQSQSQKHDGCCARGSSSRSGLPWPG